MSEKYTFLFAPVDAVGHFNACIGVAGQLRDRGHKVVFATPNNWRGKLEPEGFIEECYSTTSEEEVEDETKPQFNDKWGEMVAGMGKVFAMPLEEQVEHFVLPMFTEIYNRTKNCETIMKRIVSKVKPDAIIVDTVGHSPALLSAGIPWILSVSMVPIGISSKNVPPMFSGYPTDGDRTLWEKFDRRRRELYADMFEDFNKWVIENGGPELEFNFPFFINDSPYANIYMYPIELDYTGLRPNPPNWHRFDAFVRSTEETFEIPEELKKLPGKLIYFSMGSIGCSESGLMRRLIAILAKSPNRFIVSKGPLGDKLALPDNMWGANKVPQTKVIPLVDLVITHGGNNTVAESFYFGKRVLVLPLFGDQPDNGQRIFETGLGLQFHPYHVTETELLPAIESTLKDELLERRMISISKRIQSSNSQSGAADVIENVARNNKVES